VAALGPSATESSSMDSRPAILRALPPRPRLRVPAHSAIDASIDSPPLYTCSRLLYRVYLHDCYGANISALTEDVRSATAARTCTTSPGAAFDAAFDNDDDDDDDDDAITGAVLSAGVKWTLDTAAGVGQVPGAGKAEFDARAPPPPSLAPPRLDYRSRS
jgi:hypothetical protein